MRLDGWRNEASEHAPKLRLGDPRRVPEKLRSFLLGLAANPSGWSLSRASWHAI